MTRHWSHGNCSSLGVITTYRCHKCSGLQDSKDSSLSSDWVQWHYSNNLG